MRDFDLTTRPGTIFLVVAVFAAVLMFYRLEGTPLRGLYDDVDRSLIARNMVDSGDWIVPRYLGRPLPTKPPLMYWTAAVLGRLTGRSDELPGQLASALSMWVTVLSTWWIGMNLLGRRTALLAGLLLPTMYLFLAMSRQALVDTVMMAGFALCTGSVVHLACAGPRRRGLWWLAAALGLGGTFLAKGPVALPVLLLIGVPLAAEDPRLRPGKVALAAMLLLLAAMLLPWPLAVLQAEPEAAKVWHREFFGRFGDGRHFHPWTQKPFWFYLPDLANTAPWLPLLPAAVATAWQRRRDRSWRVLLWWGLGGLVFFSLASATKRSYYLLPLYPAFALLVAGAWQVWFGESAVPGRPVRMAAAATFALVAAVGLGMVLLPWRFAGLPATAFRVGGAVGLAGGGAALFLLFRGSGFAALPVAILAAGVLELAWFGHYVPAANGFFSGREFYAEAAPLIGDRQVVLLEVPVALSAFYLHGHRIVSANPQKMPDLLAGRGRIYLTTPSVAAGYPELAPVLERTLTGPFGDRRALGLYRRDRDR